MSLKIELPKQIAMKAKEALLKYGYANTAEPALKSAETMSTAIGN